MDSQNISDFVSQKIFCEWDNFFFDFTLRIITTSQQNINCFLFFIHVIHFTTNTKLFHKKKKIHSETVRVSKIKIKGPKSDHDLSFLSNKWSAVYVCRGYRANSKLLIPVRYAYVILPSAFCTNLKSFRSLFWLGRKLEVL